MEFYQIKPYKYQHTMLKVFEAYRALYDISNDFENDVQKRYAILPSCSYNHGQCARLMMTEDYNKLCNKFENFAKFFFKRELDMMEEVNVVFFTDPYAASAAASDTFTINVILLIKHERYEKELFDMMKGIFIMEDGSAINVVSVISKEDFYSSTIGISKEEAIKEEEGRMNNIARFAKDLCKYYIPDEAIMNNSIVALNHVIPSYLCYIDADTKMLEDLQDYASFVAKACINAGATPYTREHKLGRPSVSIRNYIDAIGKYCEHATLVYAMIENDTYPHHQNYIPEDNEITKDDINVTFSIYREYEHAREFTNASLIYYV